jgi:N-dimethylarginine dimethylaminohydrolase
MTTCVDLGSRTTRTATPRRYLMCRPTHFGVSYEINPWMDLAVPVDLDRALAQWEALRRTYLDLGHAVELIDPVPGLPDMVFAANGGLVAGGAVVAPRFTFPERAAEEDAYAAWLARLGPVARTRHRQEGEGDVLTIGDRLLAGTGFRTDREAHAELAALTGLEVITLTLVDPRYYHLDTALAVLDERTVAYLPEAFDAVSQDLLAQLFPGAIRARADDAAVLGLNAVSDGRHVVVAAAALGLQEQLAARGFVPVPVDVSELRKAGGGAKCCTLELR